MKIKDGLRTMPHGRGAAVMLALLSAFVLSACSEADIERPELLPPVNAKLETAVAERGALGSIGIYDGIVEPDIEEICFEREGYVYDIYVSAGEDVEEGDVIASIVGPAFNEISDLEEEISDIEESNEELFKLYAAELELLRLNGEDTAETELLLAQERRMAELKLEQKRRRLDELKQSDIGYIYVTSPCDCRVLAASSLGAGAFVGEDTPICAICGDGEPKITCKYMSEKTINALHDYYAIIHGIRYDLIFHPYSKEELAGMSAAGVTPLSVFTIDMTALTDEQAEGLENISEGDYALIVTEEDYRDDILIIPINAVQHDSNGKFVYEVVDNARVKRYIETGISDNINIEVKSGIEEGAYIYVKN